MSLCLSVLISLFKAVQGDADCDKKGKALVGMGDVYCLHRAVFGVDLEIPEGYLESTNRLLHVFPALDHETTGLSEDMAAESAKGMVVLLERSAAHVAGGLSGRERARGLEVHGIADVVWDVIPAMGYDPARVLLNVQAVQPCESGRCCMPAGTFEALMDFKNQVGKNYEERGPSTATQGAKGEEPSWGPFDNSSNRAVEGEIYLASPFRLCGPQWHGCLQSRFQGEHSR